MWIQIGSGSTTLQTTLNMWNAIWKEVYGHLHNLSKICTGTNRLVFYCLGKCLRGLFHQGENFHISDKEKSMDHFPVQENLLCP